MASHRPRFHPGSGRLSGRPAAAAHPAGAALLLGALGVVFGDIGISPIYAFRETLRAAGVADDASGASSGTAFGVLSLIFWAVTLVVALKYVVLVMRADNQGEGGTLSLLSLAVPAAPERLRFVGCWAWRGRRCSSVMR